MPAALTAGAAQAAPGAHAAQVPVPLPPLPPGNACAILALNLGPVNLNLLGLVVRTNEIQLRIDAINLMNNPYFSAPTVTPGSLPSGGNALGSFGFTTAPVRQPPRDIQIGGRFTF